MKEKEAKYGCSTDIMLHEVTNNQLVIVKKLPDETVEGSALTKVSQ